MTLKTFKIQFKDYLWESIVLEIRIEAISKNQAKNRAEDLLIKAREKAKLDNRVKARFYYISKVIELH